MTQANTVGVVAIGRNEGERLVRCLMSVRQLARHVIYVNSGSTDGSASAAERLEAKVVNLDLTKPFTAARARNAGFAALKKIDPDIRFVQFLDGDCTMASKWIESALVLVNDRNDVAIVCGRLRERYPKASIYNELLDLEWDTTIGEVSSCGGLALVRVEAFESVGGFRPDLIAGEEPELCLRLRERGWKIWRLDADMAKHDAAMKHFGQWWRRTVRGGYGMADVCWLYRNSPSGIWRREVARAIFWGGALPLIIGLGTLVHPAALIGVLAYVYPICRNSLSRGPASSQSWKYALHTTVAKFGEFQGICKFIWHRSRNRNATLIEYK